MTRLIFCDVSIFKKPEVQALPGMKRFSDVTRIYGKWVMPVDRSGTIQTPLNLHSLYPLPAFTSFAKPYADICDERAQQILTQADTLQVNIFVRYSGGIDSTLMLVALLKHATPAQKKRIVVLLSQESILENQEFYREHINGKLRVESSILFAHYIGTNDILLSAELNDQLLGSNMLADITTMYGPSKVHEKYSRELLTTSFTFLLGGDKVGGTFFFELFERMCAQAPVPIHSHLDFVWWVNFVTKWQPCLYYVLLYTLPRNAPQVTDSYINSRFIAFYNTPEFQLWSMNNLDKRIKDTWKSYKWISKDYIYDYTKDANYRDNKTKVRSLPTVLRQQKLYNTFLTEGWVFSNNIPLSEITNPHNDFL